MPNPGARCKCGHVSGAHGPHPITKQQVCLMCGCQKWEEDNENE